MTADGGEFAAAAAEEEPAGGRKSSLSEPGALVLDPELDDSWSLQNQLFSRLAARNSQSASYPGLGFADRDSGGWRSAWRFSGELALGAGSSTWADRDLQEYFLREQRTTAHGNTFSFTQAYRVDRSWANSGTLILGARQELESFLWNGDLVLDEEYRSFKDKDMPVYDRRDSLFKLRFTPEWDAGRTRSRLDYKYSAHIYDQLSPYSYKLHQARFRLERDFSDKLFGEVSSELSRYRYTRPGVYSNNRHQLGTRLAWEATGDLTLTAAAKLEERDYPDRQLFSYQRDTAALSAELRPDDSSTLALGGETVRNERDAAPGDYRDTRYFTHYQRALSPGLDMSARYEDRRKHYRISPLDNLDQQTTRLALDAYPADAWNVRLDLARRVSDLALPVRSYTADESILSAAYYSGAWRCNASAGRLDQRYEVDGLRGFTRDSLRFDAACDLERTRLSAYYGGAWLDQDNPAARNGYVETCLGAACEIELDAGTMLRLCYDSSIRDYKNGYSLEDTLFEAKLAFDF